MSRKDEILEVMLSVVDSSLSKIPGDFIYESLYPAAERIAELEVKANITEEKLDIENLKGEELEKRVHDRTGLTRRKSTFAIGVLIVEGNGVVNIGDLFETKSGLQYAATETKTIDTSGTVSIKSLESGPIGVVPANRITQIPVTLAGITSVTNPEPTYDGFEAESDVDLLQRYYERRRTPSTSGNKHQYKSWAKEVEGVGDAKVFPLWNGDNTVKVVIINAERLPASSELIESVQDYIDPGISGLGEGEAALGAFCTVVSATGKSIDVAFSVTSNDGYTDTDVISIVSKNLTEHFKEIAFQQDYVSYAQIGSIIFNSEGVADYTNLTVEGTTENVLVAAEEVPVLGGVTLV